MAAILITILSIFGITCMVQAQQNSSTTRRPTPSIIYGTPAEEGEIPFQVLLYNALNGSSSGTRCGGSLIYPNWVLTAAHCLSGNDFSDVSMGSVHTQNMYYYERSYQRFIHEEYERPSLFNDIALIKLPVPAQGMNIDVVPLPDRSAGPLTGQPSVVSGFGLTENGTVSDFLLRVDLEIISNEACNMVYSNIPDTKVCARWTTREGESSCFGDSGGPLTAQVNGVRMVVGIVSSGSPTTCDSGDESVYTRVSEFNDWIETIIANNP